MSKSLNPLIYNGFKAFFLARCKGFEPLTFWFVVKIITKNIVQYLNENR